MTERTTRLLITTVSEEERRFDVTGEQAAKIRARFSLGEAFVIPVGKGVAYFRANNLVSLDFPDLSTLDEPVVEVVLEHHPV